MLIISLVLGILAVARITRLLVDDQLTISWRRWVVKKYGPESMPSYFVHCPWCVSMWVATPVMPVATFFPYPWLIALLAIPAASMVAGLMNKGD